MEYTVIKKEDFPILKVEGNLTSEMDSLALVDYAVNNVLGDNSKFIIDLEKLSFLNSSGLGALITLLSKARRDNGDIVIININEQVKKLLVITRLNTIFTVMNNSNEAVQFLSKQN